MSEPIRILIVEDLPTDADLAMREIRKSLADCEFQRVETEPAFLEALEKFNPDLVLSDYHLPRFTGMQALRLVLERTPLTPVIIYTGSLNEDIAVDCMKAGAANYIIKENIKRLGSAVVHALEEKQMQIGRMKAEASLRIKDQAIRSSLNAIAIADLAGNLTYVNPAFLRLWGYDRESDVLGKLVIQFWQEKDKVAQVIEAIQSQGAWIGELSGQRNDDTQFDAQLTANILKDDTDQPVGMVASFIDITERKRADEKIEDQLRRLSTLRAIDTAISSSTDLRVTLNILVSHVTIQLGVDAAAVLLLNNVSNELEYSAGHGFRNTGINRLRVKMGEEYAGTAALERRTVSIHNLVEANPPFPKPDLIASENFVAFYAVPLIAKGQVKGVLEIFHRAPLKPDQEWVDFLDALAGQAAIAIDDGQLFEGLQRSNADLTGAYDATIEGWSQAMDLRDKETEGHTRRVTDMTVELARAAGMNETEIVHLRRGALLHDIGKLGVPDAILLKTGQLTDEEWLVMRKHPQYAYDMLTSIEYLHPALVIPYCHHEKWDGTGYPRQLKGQRIPLAARLFSVVDVWDALRSDRPYRLRWNEEKVLEYIRTISGTHFDPQAVELFFKVLYKKRI